MRVVPVPLAQVEDVEFLIKAHHGAIVVESADEQRVDALFEYVAEQLRLPYWVWRVGTGLLRIAPGSHPIHGTDSIAGCLRHLLTLSGEALFQLKGLDRYYDDSSVMGYVEELATRFMNSRASLLVCSTGGHIPAELTAYSAIVSLVEPNPREYYDYIRAVVEQTSARVPVRISLTAREIHRLLRTVRGLTFLELRKILTSALVEHGRLDASVFERVSEAKRRTVQQSGMLEYFPSGEKLDDIAGLTTLKDWLRLRQGAFQHPDQAAAFGLSPPRGILLLGVQGCGKSLCAKAVSAAWELPLLRFDPARIFDRFVGQTERNLAEAMRVAERLSPVVLWIDELEKAFAQSDGDGGVSARVLGGFLAWMQERKETVFVIATANDISRLPPELLRKGRFDEIFFVDLPDVPTRKQILAIHLRRRKRNPADFDLDQIAHASEGFSGAELEQVIVGALYACFSLHAALTTSALLDELKRTRPLSITMAEPISHLRAWVKERAVPAG